MTDELYKLLHRPLWTKAKIRSKQAQIDDLRMMMLPGAIRYDRDKVQTSPEDPMLKYVARLNELEIELHSLQDKYLGEQKSISETIEKLSDPNEQDVLIRRYINGMYFERIAESIPVSISTVYRWHRVGLNHLEEIIGGVKDDSQ